MPLASEIEKAHGSLLYGTKLIRGGKGARSPVFRPFRGVNAIVRRKHLAETLEFCPPVSRICPVEGLVQPFITKSYKAGSA